MCIAVVPNRNSLPAILLRESFREHGKVKNRTLANISHWPPAQTEAPRQVLKGHKGLGPPLADAFELVRSLPHGHVAAVLGTLRRLKLCQSSSENHPSISAEIPPSLRVVRIRRHHW
jgi:hypothetical protein